jgi:glycogen debranching enzyme
MDGGRGLRTLSSTSGGYDPLSYHCGSVWPHDTAIAVLGLAGIGRHDVAGSLGEGLVTAAGEFSDRLPELYAEIDGEIVSYPTACRPQAWAAAGAVSVVTYLSNGTLPTWTLPD